MGSKGGKVGRLGDAWQLINKYLFPFFLFAIDLFAVSCVDSDLVQNMQCFEKRDMAKILLLCSYHEKLTAQQC